MVQKSNFRNNRPSSAGSTKEAPKRSFGNKQRPSRSRGGGLKKSTLDPNLLIKKAIITDIKAYVSERTFEKMPISPKLKECINSKGFKRPIEIQDRTLESLLNGKDLLGIAQTGTGKTGAFLIPIIEHILQKNKTRNYALVVVPTRELATQVEDEFRSVAKGLGLSSACFIGGTNINSDFQKLRKQNHVIIGTPGRLLDLIQRRVLDLTSFNTLVLYEFNRMLDMGFVHDVKRILREMQQRKHTMLFSATLDKTQQKLIDTILHNPITVKVSQGDSSSDTISQAIIRTAEGENKFDVLFKMVSQKEFQKVLLFEDTKHKAKKLCAQLNKIGIKSDEIQGNKSQNARQCALNTFKEGSIQVLVATDEATRGIDVSDVSHVINYQVPLTFDSYIHRIGRTGRAGKTGKAFTFVD